MSDVIFRLTDEGFIVELVTEHGTRSVNLGGLYPKMPPPPSSCEGGDGGGG